MTGFRGVRRLVRAEVLEEGVERGGRVERVPVVVPGDREDRRRVVLVGVIELLVVARVLAVVVDDVAQVEEERGLVGQRGLVDLASHVVGDVDLGAGAVHAAGVADGVEDEPTRLADRTRPRGQDGRQVEVEGCPPPIDLRGTEPVAAVPLSGGTLGGRRRRGVEEQRLELRGVHGAPEIGITQVS